MLSKVLAWVLWLICLWLSIIIVYYVIVKPIMYTKEKITAHNK